MSEVAQRPHDGNSANERTSVAAGASPTVKSPCCCGPSATSQAAEAVEAVEAIHGPEDDIDEADASASGHERKSA